MLAQLLSLHPVLEAQLLRWLPFLRARLFGNPVGAYLVAAAGLAGLFAFFLLLRRFALRGLKDWAKLTRTDVDDLIVDLLGQITRVEYFIISLFTATRPLQLGSALERFLTGLFLAALTYRAVRIVQRVAGYLISTHAVGEGQTAPADQDMARNLGLFANLLTWLAGTLFFLDNMGVNITSMLAGLGIGGVAVALGAQSILGDLFSAVVLYLDKPFEIGDFIIIGEHKGTVEHVGVKTTRLRALSGEMLVLPNSDLTSARIRNFQELRERRVVLEFGVVYQTPVEKIKTVSRLVKDIIAATEKVRLDRVHFKGFGDSALDFEVVYFVLSADYNLFMDLNQRIHLSIMEGFENEGVQFAYPTRTLRHEGLALPSKPA